MLALKNVTVTPPSGTGLEGLCLDLMAGQILALVGNEGSGKTTLAQMLAGKSPGRTKVTGEVHIGDETFGGDALRKLSSLPPDRILVVSDACSQRLKPHRMIGQQMAEAIQARDGAEMSTAQAVARSLCERVGLPVEDDLESKRAVQLTRGQRFLVEVAYALAMRPKVLVVDDPSFALDLLQQAHLMDALRMQADQDGMAVLYLTRNLPAAAKIADALGILSDGGIVEMDQTDRLLRNAEHPTTDALLRAAVHRRRAVPEFKLPRSRAVLVVKDAVLDEKERVGGPFSRSRTLRLLDHVSLEAIHGECVGVIGVSRKALSRLCDVISGQHALTEGRVILAGVRVTPDMDESQKRRVQHIGPNPFEVGKDRQTVTAYMEGVLHPQVLSAFERDLKVGEALSDFGLPRKLADAKMGSLDAASRQRVAFARAVLARPDLIVFDEPTAWLDLIAADAFLDLMAAVQARHDFAYVLAARGFHPLRALAHRVVVLDGGRIIETGETDNVFRNPKAPHTAALVDAQPILSDVLITH